MTRRSFQYTGLQPNARYALQIRGLDGDQIPGRWSTAFEFLSFQDEIAPAPVTDLEVVVDGSNFVISWTPPHEDENGDPLDDLRDFVVTITSPMGMEEYSVTDNKFVFNYTRNKNAFGTPQPSITVIVEARDFVGNRSTPAEQAAAKPPPDSPMLMAVAKRNAVELSWTDPEDDLDRYEVWKDDEEYAKIAAGTLTWTDTDVGEGAKEYRVRAYDRFNQYGESNLVVEGEISLDIDTDTTPPKPPTGLVYTDEIDFGNSTVSANLAWDAPTEDADDTSYTDQQGFQVRYRTDTSRPWSYLVIEDDRQDGTVPQVFSADFTLPQGATAYLGVRAYDRSGNHSTWASLQESTAIDDTPPPQPAVPVLAGNMQNIQVRHSLRDSNGDLFQTNVQRLDIHVSDDPNFTPHYPPNVEDSNTLVNRASVNRLVRIGSSLVISFPYEVTQGNKDRYVRVVAVTGYPAYSPASDAQQVTVELIEGIHVEEATINDAHIQNLDANKLLAGTAIINELDIESFLTVRDNGAIRSENFNYDQQQGWAIDNGSLYLFDGEIAASLITVSEAENMLDLGYTIWSYGERWMVDNTHLSSTANTARSITSAWSRYGRTALRLQTTVTGTTTRRVTLAKSLAASDHTTQVVPDARHMASVYVKNMAGGPSDMRLRIRSGTSYIEDDNSYITLAGQEERRLAVSFTPTNEYVALQFETRGPADLAFDGSMIERMESGDDPSPFSRGLVTQIDGGHITTGSIRSNNFESGLQGWRIDLNGNVEFDEGVFRGNIEGADISGSKFTSESGNSKVTIDSGELRFDYSGSYLGSLVADSFTTPDESETFTSLKMVIPTQWGEMGIALDGSAQLINLSGLDAVFDRTRLNMRFSDIEFLHEGAMGAPGGFGSSQGIAAYDWYGQRVDALKITPEYQSYGAFISMENVKHLWVDSVIIASSSTWKNHLRSRRGNNYVDWTLGTSGRGELHYNDSLAAHFTSNLFDVSGALHTGGNILENGKRVVVHENWVNANFNTGWSNFDPNWPTLQYKVVGGLCFLKGMVRRTSGTSSIIASNLPQAMEDSAIYICSSTESPAYVQLENTTNAARIRMRTGTSFSTSRVSLGMIVYAVS